MPETPQGEDRSGSSRRRAGAAPVLAGHPRFRSMDSNADGIVSRAELAALAGHPERPTPPAADASAEASTPPVIGSFVSSMARLFEPMVSPVVSAGEAVSEAVAAGFSTVQSGAPVGTLLRELASPRSSPRSSPRASPRQSPDASDPPSRAESITRAAPPEGDTGGAPMPLALDAPSSVGTRPRANIERIRSSPRRARGTAAWVTSTHDQDQQGVEGPDDVEHPPERALRI